MKVQIERVLENGKYHVKVAVSDFSIQEIEAIKKFGAPMISVAPLYIWRRREFTSNVAIHDLNDDFEFTTETQAKSFITDLTARIKTAASTLKSYKDTFSGKNELEI